jgi:hypothetical protein
MRAAAQQPFAAYGMLRAHRQTRAPTDHPHLFYADRVVYTVISLGRPSLCRKRYKSNFDLKKKRSPMRRTDFYFIGGKRTYENTYIMGKGENTPKKSDAFKCELTTQVLTSSFSCSQAESTPATCS